MFRRSFVLLSAATFVCSAWGETTTVDTHRSIAQELVDLLSETEICLNSCRDSASVEAAVPRLRELAAKADDIVARRATLPAPTIQDDMAAEDLVNDFATLWQAICQHIERLKKEGLITAPLRDTLKLAPPDEEQN